MLSETEKNIITATIEYFLDEDDFEDAMKQVLKSSGYVDIEIKKTDNLIHVSGIDDEGDIWQVQFEIGEWVH